MIRILPLLLAAALLAGCQEKPFPAPAAPGPSAPAPTPATPSPASAPVAKAPIPADHDLDIGGRMHAPGMREPERNCASCHGSDLDGGSASSCFDCHGKVW